MNSEVKKFWVIWHFWSNWTSSYSDAKLAHPNLTTATNCNDMAVIVFVVDGDEESFRLSTLRVWDNLKCFMFVIVPVDENLYQSFKWGRHFGNFSRF